MLEDADACGGGDRMRFADETAGVIGKRQRDFSRAASIQIALNVIHALRVNCKIMVFTKFPQKL